jgi:ATP-dependent Clp protease ATP-binding subunit ClpA
MAASSQNSSAAEEYHPWTTFIDAREEARRRGDRRVGTEHLLLALLMEPAVASALGVDLHTACVALDEMDRDALRAVGLDVTLDPPPLPDAEPARRPPRPAFRAVWQGRLPLTPAAKVVLQESSKEMRGFGGHHLGPRHVLEVLLQRERPDPAAELLARLGIDPATVRPSLARG